MAICDKINTAGQTLQSNLNARGVSCTYGKNSENKQTLKDMADLITASNLKGSNDALISISASRPYLLSGEKTDLIVKLVNGLGQPLANKSVSVSDGTSLYSGITNNDGFCVFEELANGTYTATYGTVSESITVPLCSFVDYGTDEHYSAWESSTTMSFSRDSVCTTVTPVDYTVFSTRYVTITTGNCNIEFDVYCTNVSEAFFSIRQNTTSKKSFYPPTCGISADTWYHIKITISGTTVKLYTDGVQKDSGTADSHNRFYFTNNQNVNKTIKYKNFIIY